MEQTLLALVAKPNTLETYQFLVRNQVLLEAVRDSRGYNTLHLAILSNNTEGALLLMDYVRLTQQLEHSGAHGLTELINLCNEEGFTSIHYAAFRGNLALLKRFLELGGNLHAKNKQGLEAIHIAAQGDQPLIIAWLAEQGIEIDKSDFNGGTPLHWSAFMGSEDAAALLIALGASVSKADGLGQTALHLASVSGNSRITRALLFKGANRTVKDHKGRLPIDIAIENGTSKIDKMLRTPGMLADCGLKTPLRPYKRSNTLMYALMSMMFCSTIIIYICLGHGTC
jgi:palmitoyltransferase